MTAQVWECPTCGWRYESPLNIQGVSCANADKHPRGKAKECVLVATTRKGKLLEGAR